MQYKEDGIVMVQSSTHSRTPIDQATLDERKNGGARKKFLRKQNMDYMQVGWKNSKTMMTHFRL